VNRLRLVNARTGATIAESVEVAVSRRARRKGLLGRATMEPASALVLVPCAAIHTLFMRFAIDAVFVDETGRVVRIIAGLVPWRVAVASFAHAVIELPAGTTAGLVDVGDPLWLVTPSGRAGLSARALEEYVS
jgi:uncharacterized membrane protein (UPF0127 family)